MDKGLEPKWVKGPDTLLAVVDRLRRECNLFVLLTGPARGYVTSGLDRMGIPYRHAYLPRYEDIVPYYWALDAYLIPARDEGGPMSLLESMATGVPVVATRVGMCADIVETETNGLLAEVDDVGGLVSGIVRIFDDAEFRAALSTAGKATASRFDWCRIAAAYDELVYRPLMVDVG